MTTDRKLDVLEQIDGIAGGESITIERHLVDATDSELKELAAGEWLVLSYSENGIERVALV